MRYTTIAVIGMIMIAGCQGAPKYGGGYNATREGNRGSSGTSSPAATAYAVNPLKMGEIIDRYLGKPYAGKGNVEKGLDCSDFIGAIYNEYAAMHLPRTVENLFKSGREVEWSNLFFGDLVFFDTGGKGVSHVGIYVGFDEFAHSSSTSGVVISNLHDKYFSERYLGARRVME